MVGFLFIVNVALTSYINSNFLEEFVSEKAVGIIYTSASALALLGLIFMPQTLRAFGNYKTLLSALGATFVSLLAFVLTNSPLVLAGFFILYMGSRTIIYFSLDEFIESYSKDSATGNTRGLYLTALNVAWFLSPLLSGILLDTFGFKSVYTLALVFVGLTILFAGYWLRGYKDPVYPKRVPLAEIFAKLIRKKNIYRVYRMNLLLQFFYAWMVIYVPIYLHQHLGFAWTTLGVMFTIMLLPFLLFELPLGRLADSKYGEKEIMNIGLLVMVSAVLLVAGVMSHNVILWTAILFFSRTGAAMVEISLETYFFKKVDGQDTDLISFYRNAAPLAYITAPLLASALLWFMPINYIFFVLAIILITGLRFSTKIEDTK